MDLIERSRGLGDVYKRQVVMSMALLQIKNKWISY